MFTLPLSAQRRPITFHPLDTTHDNHSSRASGRAGLHLPCPPWALGFQASNEIRHHWCKRAESSRTSLPRLQSGLHRLLMPGWPVIPGLRVFTCNTGALQIGRRNGDQCLRCAYQELALPPRHRHLPDEAKVRETPQPAYPAHPAPARASPSAHLLRARPPAPRPRPRPGAPARPGAAANERAAPHPGIPARPPPPAHTRPWRR